MIFEYVSHNQPSIFARIVSLFRWRPPRPVPVMLQARGDPEEEHREFDRLMRERPRPGTGGL